MTLKENASGLWESQVERPPNLPDDVLKNLTLGEQLEVNRKPFFYHGAFITDVLEFIIKNDEGPFSNPPFKENARQFMETFNPRRPSLVSPKTPNRLFWGSYNQNFMRVGEIPPHAYTKRRIFFHGRFNGIPHPGYLETLCLLRQYAESFNQEYEIWLGVDSDKLSLKKGQDPFMDPQFRAALFHTTGLVDKFILIESPEDDYDRDWYWDNLYAIDPDRLNPDVLFMLRDDELYTSKFSQTSVRTKILTEENLGNKLTMHQFDLKEGRIGVAEVRKRWNKLRDLL